MEQVTIYTDGACADNPRGNGGYGVVIVCGDNRQELAGGLRNTTNNRMEMMAAIKALETIKTPSEILLYSDSKYLLNGIASWRRTWKINNWQRKEKGGWVDVKNKDLWQQLDQFCAFHKICCSWVPGHSGNEENELCDMLAVKEIYCL